MSVPNPFLTIWLSPRSTIRHLVDHSPTLFVIPLAMLAGISSAFDEAVTKNIGDKVSLTNIMAMIVVGGILGGLIKLYVSSFFLRITGRWIGGIATSAQLRTALAWGSIPIIASLIISMIQLGLFGKELFSSSTPMMDAHLPLKIVFYLCIPIELALGIAGLVILMKCIGEVQGFSAWRAVGNCIIAAITVVVPIAILVIGVLRYFD